MLTLAWEVEDRLSVTAECLKTYRALISDDTEINSLFPGEFGAAEVGYVRASILRFKGDSASSLGYLRDVHDIEVKGDSLGNPTRAMVMDALEAHGGDARKANTFLREEHHRNAAILAKAEYQKKRESKAK